MQRIAAIKNKIVTRSSAKRFFDLIADEMKLVEAEFASQACSNIQVIDYLGKYLRDSGGKRLRPALLILANRSCGGRGGDESVIRLATVMEMLHTATLVHDDIIDNAEFRRGRASVNAEFGNQTAVLMGDWLYMSAFENSLQERSLPILDILTRLTRKMTEGELIQLTKIGDLNISRASYFDILRRKTAYLISGCCEIGALLAKASEDIRLAMRGYGMALGIAFQLADDLLDVTSDQNTLGKAAGADLLEGKLTLPLIILTESEPSIVGLFDRIVKAKEYLPSNLDEIERAIKKHDVVEKVRHTANEFALESRNYLDVLPESEYRVALEELPKFVLNRKN